MIIIIKRRIDMRNDRSSGRETGNNTNRKALRSDK